MLSVNDLMSLFNWIFLSCMQLSLLGPLSHSKYAPGKLFKFGCNSPITFIFCLLAYQEREINVYIKLVTIIFIFISIV
jgi:hypothetical protein